MSGTTTNPDEVISENYEEFLTKLSDLLTFVPEEERRGLIEGFVRGVMQS